jgi:hypothetical protein
LNGAAAIVNMKTGVATLTQTPGARVQGLIVPNEQQPKTGDQKAGDQKAGDQKSEKSGSAGAAKSAAVSEDASPESSDK